MAKNKGARAGEVCALCGDPMNAGFIVCGDCGAVRSEQPTAWTILGAFGGAYLSFLVTEGVSGGIRTAIVIGVFFAILIFGPQKIVYTLKQPQQ